MSTLAAANSRHVCLDGPHDCDGPVEPRWPGHGERLFPRCVRHAADRIRTQEEINQRYPDSPCAPADFDPAFAGERWDEDY